MYIKRRWPKYLIALVILFLLLFVPLRGMVWQNIFSNTETRAVTPSVQVNRKIADQHHLADLNYNGQQVVEVNDNTPEFNSEDLSISKGAWQKLSDRDWEGRAQVANAMLNQTLMPKVARQRLTVNPTGYHSYKDQQGNYLYNRSHLIGYQLTGLNNNLENLVTGTVALNATHLNDAQGSMELFENQVATYLREDRQHYVRYRVTPIYQNIDLVPKGIEMEAKSVSDNAISFNVYIFNNQPGWHISYLTGIAGTD